MFHSSSTTINVGDIPCNPGTAARTSHVDPSGITALFRPCGPEEALRFVAMRDVFDPLEKIVDRFDDAANAIEGIVVEHV